jgi:hypothetical protein
MELRTTRQASGTRSEKKIVAWCRTGTNLTLNKHFYYRMIIRTDSIYTETSMDGASRFGDADFFPTPDVRAYF